MIKLFMDGRVAKDAKVFEYGKGRDAKTGVSFGIICDRFYGDKNPTYIQCTIFNADERIAQHVTTGRQLVIHGDLTRNDEGYYSCTVDQFDFGQTPQRERDGDRGYRGDYHDDPGYQNRDEEDPRRFGV